MAMPPLMPFGGQWPPYEEELYQVFLDTLLHGRLTFQGLRVSVRKHPEYNGKHAAFWHLISDGDVEEDRLPDMRRCERFRWIAWMITNATLCSEVVIWTNRRGREYHVLLLHTTAKYLVVLAKRTDHFLLVSAYPPRPRRLEGLLEEYENSRPP
jgi:hypothetical protein